MRFHSRVLRRVLFGGAVRKGACSLGCCGGVLFRPGAGDGAGTFWSRLTDGRALGGMQFGVRFQGAVGCWSGFWRVRLCF